MKPPTSHRFGATFVVTLCLAVFAATAVAQTYDAFADFSATTNPNGPWAYGSTTSATSAFVVGEVPQSAVDGALVGWSPVADPFLGYPFVLKPTTGSNVVWGTTNYPADALALHPEHFGRYAAVQFTVPLTGEYALVAAFADIFNFVTTTVDVHVRLNGSDLFMESLDSSNPSAFFSTSLVLEAGGQLDFLVGSRGEYFFDHTAFNATIRRLPAESVPEPATTALLLGSALLGLARFRRVTLAAA